MHTMAPMWIVSAIDMAGSSFAIVLSLYAVLFMRGIYLRKSEHTLVTFLYLQTVAMAIFAVSRSAGHILKHIMLALDMKALWQAIAPVSGSVNSFTFIVFGISALVYSNVRNASRRVMELEHRKAALKESEEKYRSLIESSPDMIHLLDPGGRILNANPAESSTLGYTQGELLGMSALDIVPADQHQSFTAHNMSVSEAGHKTYETEFLTRDGRRIPVEINSMANYAPGGTLRSTLCIIRDITERRQSQDEIRKSLHEKEVLLKEVHHRVKNNMQVVSSLLNLQSGRIGDRASLQAFRESSSRIRAMALAHECLYNSGDLANIRADEYIGRLCKNIRDSLVAGGGQVEIVLDIEDITLNIDTLIPCGLIINELMTNSLQYAFGGPEGQGEIRLSLRRQGQTASLMVSDNGCGLPPGMDIYATETLGLQLVHSLVTQLEGTMQASSNGGTSFLISFPLED